MSVKAVREVPAEVPVDEFNVLEEKVYRTIELYKGAREARSAAERDVQRLRQQLEEREEELEGLRREMIALKREREEVRGRVENMLRQIESLTEEAAERPA
jgi:chromosome segregation ATPase